MTARWPRLLATSALPRWTLFAALEGERRLPANGLLAYFVSLYPWLLFVKVSPLWLLVVPALHSLQYLAVVWRFEANYEKARLAEPDTTGSLVRRCGPLDGPRRRRAGWGCRANSRSVGAAGLIG